MRFKLSYSKQFLKVLFSFFCLIAIAFVSLGKVNALELSEVIKFTVSDIDVAQKEFSLNLQTKKDFKIYQENLSFELSVPGSFPESLSYTFTPDAKLIFDPFSNKDKYVFENGTVLHIKADRIFDLGDKLSIFVQACSVDVCLLPSTLGLTITQNSSSSPSLVSSPNLKSFKNTTKTNKAYQEKEKQNDVSTIQSIQNSPNESTGFSETVLNYLKAGSIFLFPILFLAGLLTNLTPCVYPMIPITLSVMSQFGKGEKSPVKLAFVYMIGMVITYSLLGVGAAMTGQVFGSQLASPILNAVVAGIMILLGFAMLDFFDLSVLQRLSYKIPSSNKSPILAVGTMGAVSGLVAAPCTGPILSMILVLIAQTREPITGFFYMLSFALGFGAPYVVLGVVSQRLNKLPKMNKLSTLIKLFFACLMFALAFYFLKSSLANLRVFNFLYVQPEWTDVLVVCGLLLLCSRIKQPRIGLFAKLAKFGVITTFSLLCLWLTLWISSAFVAPYTQENSHTFSELIQTSEIKWKTDLSLASKEAKKSNKKILVDIWAEWCAACLEMEHTTWKDPQVIKIITDNYIAVKIDYTKPSSETSELLNDWKILGLPAVLIFNPTDLKKPLEVNQGLIKTSKLIQELKSF